MEDYTKARASKEPKKEEGEEKKVEKIVKGEVVTRKKPLGRKFKDLFVSTDARSLVRYVCADVLLPAARNMIVDATTKGIEQMMFGNDPRRRPYGQTGSRISYNSPINRGLASRDQWTRPPIGSPQQQSVRQSRTIRDDYILSSREEADLVLERMVDIINQYEIVSVADLNELVGFPSNHTDNKWGWNNLSGVGCRQVRDGFILDLPPMIPLT